MITNGVLFFRSKTSNLNLYFLSSMADAEATREYCPERLQAASRGRSWCSADRSVWGAGNRLDQHHRDHAQRHLRWKVPRDLIYTYKPFSINSYKVSPPFCIIHVLFDIPSFPYPIVRNSKIIMPLFCNHICFWIYFLFEFCGIMFPWVNILACIYMSSFRSLSSQQ